MAAVRCHAKAQGADEVRVAPPADAVFRIGGDVGAVEHAERGFELASAGEQGALALPVRVAAGATGGLEHVPAPGHGVRRARARHRFPGRGGATRSHPHRRQPGEAGQGGLLRAHLDQLALAVASSVDQRGHRPQRTVNRRAVVGDEAGEPARG